MKLERPADEQTTRRLVEAPLGASVVCWDAEDDVTIKILDSEERVLGRAQRHPDE